MEARPEVELGRLDSLIVSLYDEPSYPDFRIDEISTYLNEKIGVNDVRLRPKLLEGENVSNIEGTAHFLASCKVIDPLRRGANKPTKAEVEYEKSHLGSCRSSSGLIYDGIAIQRLLCELIPEEERIHKHLHCVFSERLLATWDTWDSRYHLRTVICGLPCIVSLTGLVEAPAREPAYYIARRYLGRDPKVLGSETDAKRCLVYGDPRTTRVALGYVMQSLWYWIGGEPFCTDPACRLYNAHRQSTMLHSQLGTPEYCRRHETLLLKVRAAH